ncbi:MAG: hypothetical protein AAB390_03505 [Patescibacteria group bacterium]
MSRDAVDDFLKEGEDKVPASTIIVQHKDGSPARGVRVVVGFIAGMTPPVYTNDNGVAVIEHHSTGTARVYVDHSQKEAFKAPGKCVVTLS